MAVGKDGCSHHIQRQPQRGGNAAGGVLLSGIVEAI